MQIGLEISPGKKEFPNGASIADKHFSLETWEKRTNAQ
jgi:hypothetical protein